MNLKKKLRHLAEKALVPRNYGKTETMIKACQALDGVLLCSDVTVSADITRKYGVVAKSIDTNLEGIRGPFFFDSTAINKLLNRAANKIEEQEEKEAHYDALKSEVEELRAELREYRSLLLKDGLEKF